MQCYDVDVESCLSRLVALVRECPRGRLTEAYVAGRLGFCAKHLNRLVQRATGEPAGHFIQRLLRERATVALCLGEESVKEIARQAHFSSTAAFTRSIAREYGTPPSEISRLNSGRPPDFPGARALAGLPLPMDASQVGVRVADESVVTYCYASGICLKGRQLPGGGIELLRGRRYLDECGGTLITV